MAKMFSFKLIYFVILMLDVYKANSKIPEKILCVDEKCQVPVSVAKTLLRYSSPDPRILSFAPNTNIKIFSKEAESQTNLWGAEINGKRGFIPKHLVRESKIFNKPTVIVDSAIGKIPNVPSTPNKENIEPDKVKQLFEVVDGTTVYGNSPDINNLSVADKSIPSISVPPVGKLPHNTEPVSEKDISDQAPVKDIQQSVDNPSSAPELKHETSNVDDDDDDDDDDDENEEDEDETSVETEDYTLNKLNVKLSPYNFVVNEKTIGNENTVNHMDIFNQTTNPETKVVPDSPLVSDPKAIEDTAKDDAEMVEKNTTNNVSNEVSKDGVSSDSESLPKTQDSSFNITDAHQKLQKMDDNGTDTAPVVSDPKAIEVTAKYDVETFEKNAKPLENEVNKGDMSSDNQSVPKTEEIPSSSDITDEHQKLQKIDNNNGKDTSSDAHQKLQKMDDNGTDTAPVVSDPKAIEVTAKDDVETVEKNAKTLENEVNKGDMSSDNQSVPKTEEIPNSSDITDEHQKLQKIDNSNGKDTSSDVLTEKKLDGSSHNRYENDLKKNSNEMLTETQEENTVDKEIERNKTNADEKSNTEEEIVEPKSTVSKDENDVSKHSNLNENIEIEASTFPLSSTSENFESKENITKINENASGTDVPENMLEPNDQKEVTKDIDNSEIEINSNLDRFSHNSYENDIQKNSNEVFNETREEKTVDKEIESNNKYSDEISNTEEEITEEISRDYNAESDGIFSKFLSLFGNKAVDEVENNSEQISPPLSTAEQLLDENLWTTLQEEEVVLKTDVDHCQAKVGFCNNSEKNIFLDTINLNFNSDIFLYLMTTAISCIIFLFVYLIMDRSKREAPLVAKINKLEKKLLVTIKENDLLQEKCSETTSEMKDASNELVDQLTQQLAELQLNREALEVRVRELHNELESKVGLEEQIESLEKELETSTEVGMELNRIISEILEPSKGADKLKENVEQLQRQLLEQRDTINKMNNSVDAKEKENAQLSLEIEENKKKINDLQNKLDEMVEKLLIAEKEREQQQRNLKEELSIYQEKYNEGVIKADMLNNETQVLKLQLFELQRQSEFKSQEYQILKDSLNSIKSMPNDSDTLKSLLDSTSIKAELEQLRSENERYMIQIQQEQAAKVAYEKKCQAVVEENRSLEEKYQKADKEKVEVNMKLEVLNNYFKKREEELQEELLKYKSIWDTKEGEATSTTERIKLMQDEIENYKSQNEILKREIVSQEIELKSQISVLEKKVHENWVTARQTERKMEDARQEAAQLRNRLTLKERAIVEERAQNRLQSPLEQNGDLTLSPHPMDSSMSPPLLFGGRDHITKSPPIAGLPPHFLPPPPGAPFLPPPPHGMPPFMPPLPAMFPGDHRPPPLGRMSSPPPLNSMYSPNASAFSPYDRNSPAPPYDSEYGASPVPMRGYSPYNSRDDRRDYSRPTHLVSNGRKMRGQAMSSESDHSNESVEKVIRKHSKVV